MGLVRVGPLPDEPLAAAARFYADVLERLAPASEAVTLVFGPADHRHRGWRLAAVQSLARQWAPSRVNAVAGGDEVAIRAADTYLREADGVTGQYLLLSADRSA